MKARNTLLSLSIPFFALSLLLSGCGKNTVEVPAETPDDGSTVEDMNPMIVPTSYTHAIDLNNSSLTWAAAKVVGAAHHGTVQFLSGGLYVEDGTIVGGKFEIDMTTIVDQDLQKEASRTTLETHLKSADFFDVEKYPTAKVEILSARPTGEVPPAAPYSVVANLTIKDVTKEITFPATITFNDKTGVAEYKASAQMVLDRTDWNLTYGSGNFFKELGDAAILDDMTLGFELVVKQNDMEVLTDDMNGAQKEDLSEDMNGETKEEMSDEVKG